MNATTWLLLHLVAVAVLTGVGWVVQLVVYPAFALVGEQGWTAYHARHTQAITRVVLLPWAVQGVSTVALLIRPPDGRLLPVAVLAVLALSTVVLTWAAAVPAHQRLGAAPSGGGRDLALLLRAHLARTLAWTASTGLAAVLLA